MLMKLKQKFEEIGVTQIMKIFQENKIVQRKLEEANILMVNRIHWLKNKRENT